MNKIDILRRDIIMTATREVVLCPACQLRPVVQLTPDNSLRCGPCVTCSCGQPVTVFADGPTSPRYCFECYEALQRHAS